MEKVKSILLRVDLAGRGIVNFDSNDQKRIIKGTHLDINRYNDNNKFAKKVFTKNEDSDIKTGIDYKLKISSNCIRHDMFKYDEVSMVPNVVHVDELLYSNIASVPAITRGYMFATKKETLKRTSPFKINDAIQTCNAMSAMEVGARSGEKSDNSFYFIESVGDIQYSTTGGIDLMLMQLISCDGFYDRYSFNPDFYPQYKNYLKERIPNFNSELGYHQLKYSMNKAPEYGILLSNENVVFLTKEVLKRLIKINIERSGSFTRIKSLKIKFVFDPLIDTPENENGWITLRTEADIDNLNFDVHYFYETVDLETAEPFRKKIDNLIMEIKNKENKEKKEKKSKKDVVIENTEDNE